MAGLTQALIVSASGIMILIFTTMVLGQVVDLFVYYGTTWEIQNQTLQICMNELMVFATWFYYLTFYSGLIFMIYPFIYLVKVNRYEDIVPAQSGYDEEYGHGG
jgi:type III secretory pathway component EscS